MANIVWLTISLPFVYNARQAIETHASSSAGLPLDNTNEDPENPLANTTEEKTSNSNASVSEEYLHEYHSPEQYLAELSLEYKVESMSTYIAFYGELVCPPPENIRIPV
jgi:hypothetical protein